MSICSHPYRSIIFRRHWNRSGKEALKSIKELQNHLHLIQHNHVLFKSSIRSVGSTGSSNPPNPSSKETKAPSDTKDESAKLKSNQFLENYKPLSDQTDKVFQIIKNTSKQLSDKATQYYNEKKDHFNKSKILSADGEEEHWYSARVNFMMKRYEDYIGLTDVKNAQVRVQKTEKLFVKSQDDRRETQRLINEVDGKIKNIRTELERTYRGDDKYLELVTEEHQVLKEEHMMKERLSQMEREEREAFSKLSRAVRDSHESERAQAEKTKYWAILGSIIGTSLGILGTTINNRLRMRELRQIVRDAASGHTQASVGAAALATTLSQDRDENSADVVEVKDKLENVSKQVYNVEKLTSDKINEVSSSISKMFETLDEHQKKLSETLSHLENRSATSPRPEVTNKKAFLEMQKSLETQIMRWEEKMDDIIKAHLENSNNSKALLHLEKKLSEVLVLEKEMIKEANRSNEDQNRNRAIEFDTFQKRLNDVEERLKDVRSLLLTQSALTEHQTKVMINAAASTAAAKTISSSGQNQSAKEAVKLRNERTKEALEALEKSEMVIVNTVEMSLKDHEEKINNALIMNGVFVAVITPFLVYAFNKLL